MDDPDDLDMSNWADGMKPGGPDEWLAMLCTLAFVALVFLLAWPRR